MLVAELPDGRLGAPLVLLQVALETRLDRDENSIYQMMPSSSTST